MIKAIIMIVIMITAVALYIARKLPKKDVTEKKAELTRQLEKMKEESLKYRVPVDEIERVKIEKKINEIDKINFNFDAIDFIIFVGAFLMVIYISGLKNPKTVTVFILNTILYGADGLMTPQDKKMVYEQMILKNKDYKKLNMCCDIILPAIVIITGIIAKILISIK